MPQIAHSRPQIAREPREGHAKVARVYDEDRAILERQYSDICVTVKESGKTIEKAMRESRETHAKVRIVC